MRPVFVYGLLKPGFRLHHVAAPFVLRAEPARVRGRLYDAGVPAARFDEDGHIEGFVLWVRPEALPVLDDLEDEGEMYRRVRLRAETAEGPVEAEAYEYLASLDGRPPIGSRWE